MKAGEGVKGVVEGSPKVATNFAHARKGVQLVQAQSRRSQKTMMMVIKDVMRAGGCVDKPGWMGIILKMMAAGGMGRN